MKLVTCKFHQKVLVGAVVGDWLIPFDLNSMIDMPQILAGGPANQEKLQEKIDAGIDRVALPDVTLLAPILRPGKYFGVGLNYADHIAETGLQKPEFPTIFNKQSTCVIGPGQPIQRPRISDKLD
ncbi:MAG: fumarylacetoacetate hydrolase family protein, partial [Gammaproteobacteria bacterium]